MNREELIDDFIRHCSDMFPYNDPDYSTKLLRAAENYADEMLDPNSYLNTLCREHDELLNDVKSMIKICAISDLHGHLPEIDPCELVLICGDIVPLNIQGMTDKAYKWFSSTFKEWAENLPCQKVIFIAGNHELTFPDHYNEYKQLFSNDSKVTYLCHEEYTYSGSDRKEYRIFGTPYCKKFGNWAFMLTAQELEEKFLEIPQGLDILLTHDQPYMFGDILLQKDCPWATGENIGNVPLTLAILACSPRYQFNGHLHSCDHNQIMIKDTVHYNVSLKDEKYQVVYSPLYLEIDK